MSTTPTIGNFREWNHFSKTIDMQRFIRGQDEFRFRPHWANSRCNQTWRAVRYKFLEEKQILYVEGDEFSNLYSVVEGLVIEYELCKSGRRQIVALNYPGDLFGFSSGSTHTFTTQAASPTVVEPIRHGYLSDLLENDANFRNKVVQQLTEARRQSALMVRMSAVQRVSKFLLDAHQRQAVGPNDRNLVVPITRQDMGDYLGLSTETVSRAISALKVKQIVVLRNVRHLFILDLDALSRIVTDDFR